VERKENKQQNTITKKTKTGPEPGHAAAGDGACMPRAAAGDLLCVTNSPEDPRTTREPATTPWKKSRDPHVPDQGVTTLARGEPAQPWLEAAGLEEAGDPCGEALALKKLARVSRFNYKEKPKTNKTKSGKLCWRHRKSRSPTQNRKVFCQGTTTTTESNPRGTKLHNRNGWKAPKLHWI